MVRLWTWSYANWFVASLLRAAGGRSSGFLCLRYFYARRALPFGESSSPAQWISTRVTAAAMMAVTKRPPGAGRALFVVRRVERWRAGFEV